MRQKCIFRGEKCLKIIKNKNVISDLNNSYGFTSICYLLKKYVFLKLLRNKVD